MSKFHFSHLCFTGSDLYDFGDLDDPDDDAEDDSKESEASRVTPSTPEPLTVKEQEKLPLYKSASSSRAKSPVYAQRHTRRRYLNGLLSLSMSHLSSVLPTEPNCRHLT